MKNIKEVKKFELPKCDIDEVLNCFNWGKVEEYINWSNRDSDVVVTEEELRLNVVDKLVGLYQASVDHKETILTTIDGFRIRCVYYGNKYDDSFKVGIDIAYEIEKSSIF